MNFISVWEIDSLHASTMQPQSKDRLYYLLVHNYIDYPLQTLN